MGEINLHNDSQYSSYQVAPFGLIGEKLSHSWSATIHEKLGSAPYQLHELAPYQLENFLSKTQWKGLNVTIPYKKDAYVLADFASKEANAVKAANTLVKDSSGKVYADNTDIFGFEYLLKSLNLNLNHKKVIVFGAYGGAGQAVCHVLKNYDANVIGVSRHTHSAQYIIDKAITYEDLNEHCDADLLVNATPLGMSPLMGASPISKEQLTRYSSLMYVIDVIYHPLRSQLLLDAQSLGIPIANGLTMLVAQAVKASALFLQKNVSYSLIKQVTTDLVKEKENVVLIGMPGVGKTTTGKQLAKLMNRPWIDTDDLIKQYSGMNSATYLVTHGEKAFRLLEHEVIQRIATTTGTVISCGGGVVATPSNYYLLKQNSKLIYLTRPLNELTISGRPLSKQIGVEKLACIRLPIYKAWSDMTFSCLGSAKQNAKKLFELLS